MVCLRAGFLAFPWVDLSLPDRHLVQTWLILIQKFLAPLFKAHKRDMTGPAARARSLVLFSLLLKDSCLNDTKANPLFV